MPDAQAMARWQRGQLIRSLLTGDWRTAHRRWRLLRSLTRITRWEQREHST